MNKYINLLKKLNFKTIYFNLKYLPLKQAIQLPVLISNKVYLRKLGGKIVFDCPISPGLVLIGFESIGIFDERTSRSIWEVSGTIIFQGKAYIGHGSKICVGPEGKLILGSNFTISAETSIVAFSKIQFGHGCMLSWDILIMDTDFHKIKDSKGVIINNPKPIIIGDKVWICCQSTILKGALIPNNCIIAAGSLVANKLELENSLYAGKPAKHLKSELTWEL